MLKRFDYLFPFKGKQHVRMFHSKNESETFNKLNAPCFPPHVTDNDHMRFTNLMANDA
jgi:hypothetical protein